MADTFWADISTIPLHTSPAEVEGAMCLPSGNAAIKLIDQPNLKNLIPLVGTMVLRSTLVAAGLYFAGARGKELTRYTFASTAGIEAGVLAWAFYKKYYSR